MPNVNSLRDFSTSTELFIESSDELRFTAYQVRNTHELQSHRDEFIQGTTNSLKIPFEKLQHQLSSMLKAQVSGQLTPLELNHRLANAETLCSKINKLINGLVDLSIAESHCQLRVQVRESNLCDIAADVLERLFDQALEKGSHIKFYCPTVVIGEWDILRLDQLVSNLVLNAVNHAPGSTIDVRITRTSSHAQLEVKDTGPGIPFEKQSKIFERFTKVDEASEGFGNGLWLVKKIVERFHGSLRLVSWPGEGSTFIVELPLRQMLH
ncbi:MAG: HAMP domain-containing histidine kinase [Bdellovibrionales bacterium]|nr:HAMP domain-containing histidine kinase [Bdellovibrionales bacterium]